MSKGENGKDNYLREAYEGLQAQLSAGLAASRKVIGHPVAKGDGAETKWLEILQKHLPIRYQAEKAFVVDSNGDQSDQIDIVIYDRQYTPELYNLNGQKVIPAEGIYAVLEVKQTLDKGNVEYAGRKVSSVRNLVRTSAPIIHAGGEYKPREITHILGGILSTDNEWNPPFGEAFYSSICSETIDERLDIGCVANLGGFKINYDSEGKPEISISSQEHALSFFFLQLSNCLQMIGTVPAIDYEAYLVNFDMR